MQLLKYPAIGNFKIAAISYLRQFNFVGIGLQRIV